MATFLYKMGRSAFRRRWLVTFLWITILAIAGVGAATSSSSASGSVSIPGTEAQKAFDLLKERFPGTGADGATARVVFKAPSGERITATDNKAAVEDVVSELGSGSNLVASVTDPYVTKSVSKDGSTAYAQVTYKVKSNEMTDAARDALDGAVQSGRDDGLTVEAGGDALQTQPENGIGEIVGIAIAALVLVITFGSMVAAGLPLLIAIIGVGISVAGITALSGTLNLDSSTPTLAMMIGLAVGIDYALFVVSRYRTERAEGRTPEEAVGRATGTAGSAVVFAGLTVVIALAGLVVVNIPVLTKMGLAAAAAVVVAVLVALTFIPALLGFAGDKVLSRRTRKARNARKAHEGSVPAAADAKPNMGTRWASFVLRRPVAVLVTAIVGLGVIAVPATGLTLGMPDDGSQPTSTTQRKAYDMLADSFGPGFNGPLMVVVDAASADDPQAAAAKVSRAVSGLKDVTAVTPATFSKAGDTAMITVIPGSSPTSTATEDLVKAIRDKGAAAGSAAGATVLVTGQTAMAIDVSQKLSDALIPYLGLVVGLAFLLLILVFRSILVPLKAALGFLLSVFASLGAVVAVFQWGWLANLFGVQETGPIMSMMPIFLVGVVFGLAMDYEVFLVTRMREAYVHGERPAQAIVTGFNHGARVVTAAAIIMISVFAGFITAHEAMVKMIGFGLAIAVLFDAFVVRMAIVPAVMALLGKAAWWLPRWLDKALPDVDIEGEQLRRNLDTAAGEAVPPSGRELQDSRA
ncbi:MMPL family transporter [Streptomyces sp. NBC_01537]|uniref:MMPL family transporter n=1 Tax=Streptomyces sp. NBC_01537 TaxID=2903896 RepID=UPI0038658787